MKSKLNVRAVLFSTVVFFTGFGVGVFVKSELLVPSNPIDIDWHAQFTEDQNHQRIMEFQHSLDTIKASGTKDVGELSRQLDTQVRIEDLVIRSREAEYAKWTPFTPLFTGGAGALLGFLTGLLGRKPGTSPEKFKPEA